MSYFMFYLMIYLLLCPILSYLMSDVLCFMLHYVLSGLVLCLMIMMCVSLPNKGFPSYITVSCLLSLFLFFVHGSSMSQNDVRAQQIIEKEAAEWYGEFNQVLIDQSENQTLIYQLLIYKQKPPRYRESIKVVFLLK